MSSALLTLLLLALLVLAPCLLTGLDEGLLAEEPVELKLGIWMCFFFFSLFSQPVSMVQTVYGWVDSSLSLARWSQLKHCLPQFRSIRSPIWVGRSLHWCVNKSQRAMSPWKSYSTAPEGPFFWCCQQVGSTGSPIWKLFLPTAHKLPVQRVLSKQSPSLSKLL